MEREKGQRDGKSRHCKDADGRNCMEGSPICTEHCTAVRPSSCLCTGEMEEHMYRVGLDDGVTMSDGRWRMGRMTDERLCIIRI